MRLLVTGATGKVGQAFLNRFLRSPEANGCAVRATSHRRDPPQSEVETVKGTLADPDFARRAMDGVTHVVHLATCKETPLDVMDVAVKGMFWLLEEARRSSAFERFVLVGGDAAMGHFFYPHPAPVTETQGHAAYPGCYALSKVLEETMLTQYAIQYGLPVACLRAPWIMEKDDFRFTLSWGDDVFGGPRWRDLVGSEAADGYARTGTIPVLCDAEGRAILRNFVHVEDLVEALILSLRHPAAEGTFNVSMDEPVDYRKAADYLAATRGLPSVDVRTPYHSTWLDNAKAKMTLGWRPRVDLARLIDASWDYVRGPDDPRTVWYPG